MAAAPKPSIKDLKKKKDEKKDEDLSEEDLALKQQLEMCVERVQDSNPGVRKLALESMMQKIRTSVSSTTSDLKPLKFLCPHYGTLKAYYETTEDSLLKKYLADILSLLAISACAEHERESLKYRLLGSGYNYVRSLAGEIKQDFQNCQKQEKIEESLDAMGHLKNSLLVFATLITTVTFTAAFTLPGYKSNAPGQGTVVLDSEWSFRLFLLSDIFAMISSILATSFLLSFSRTRGSKNELFIRGLAIWFIRISSASLLVAFAVAVDIVIGSKNRCLAKTVIAMVSITLLSIVMLHIPLFWTLKKILKLKMEVKTKGENFSEKREK